MPTLDGKVKYTVPEGTQPGTVFRLRGKGIQHLNSFGKGDLYVKVTIEVPTNLSREQKDALRTFENAMDENNYTKRKSFFDKLKDYMGGKD